MTAAPRNAAPQTPPPATAADAMRIIDGLGKIMDALLANIDRETSLVRSGKLFDGSAAEAAKADLAREYQSMAQQVKTHRAQLAKLAPAAFVALGKRHDEFQAVLKLNMTVLATAHAVSQSIVRGVSDELTRQRAPSTYGATGRANTPPPRASQPLTVYRSL